jgi:fibronectin-binding autotransporter adhesin
MATIRLKRGTSGDPGATAVTNAGEMAVNLQTATTPKLFIKTVSDTTTVPLWVGAVIESSPGNWNDSAKLATQSAINTTFMPKAGGTFTGAVSFGQGSTAAGEIRLLEDTDDGSNYSAFRGSARSANITYVMPTIDPTAGQVLTASAPSSGVSNLSWEAAPAPSAVSTTNDNTNTTRYLVFSTTNGSSAPLYVDDSTTPLTYNPSTAVLSLSGSGGTLSAANLASPGNLINLFTGKVTSNDTLNLFTYSPIGGDTKTLNIGSANTNSHDGTTVINIGAGEPTSMAGSYNINIGNSKATTTIVSATVVGLNSTGNTTLGNTTITGDLTVNGTTTTINSTVTTIDDPVLVLGGDTAVADTVKDRGIEFRYGGATVTITNYIGNGTTTVTGTVASTTGWLAGDVITISGATTTEQFKLNGTWRIASIPTGTTFTFVVNTSVAAGTYTTNLGTTVRVLNGFMGYDQSEARFVLRERATNDGSDTFSGTTMGSLEINNLRLAGNVIQDNGGTTRITFDSAGTTFSGGSSGIKIDGNSINSSAAQVMTFSGANLTAKGTLTVEGGSISTGAAVASTLFSTTTTANVGIATGLTTGTFTVGATGSTGAVSLFPATGSQAITLGGSTTGTITIGGTGSPVNIATGASTGTVQIGSTSASAQTVNIATTTSGTTSIGGTGAVTLGAAAGSGTINIGNTGTAQAQAVNIATATTGTITIGGTGATAVILPTGKTRVGQTTLIQGGAVNITLPTAGGTLVGSGDTTLPSNITASSLTSVGTLTGLTVTGSGTNVVSLTTGSTGVMTLDTGTTGAINIGTNANAKTITVGNGTGATSLVLDCGTGALNVGANAVARTVTVGNTTGASVLNLNAGTGGVAITTGTTGTVGIDSGTTGAINIGTNANAKTITVGNGTGATSLVLNCGTGALNIGTNAVARTVTVGNTTGASALVLNAGTGAITMGAPVIFNTANVTASGTTQAGALGLTADLNFVTLGTGGVALPAATVGRKITVVNRTSVQITVYPVNGGDDTIDGAAANVGYILQPSEYGEFDCSSATAWFTNGTLDGGTY